MSQLVLKTAQEFQNFTQMCNTHKQFFDFKVSKSTFIITASTNFLKEMGYII